jgi:hypothetical protein
MDAVELLEELQRQVSDFGNATIAVVDQAQPEWRCEIAEVEFDPGSRAFTIITES